MWPSSVNDFASDFAAAFLKCYIPVVSSDVWNDFFDFFHSPVLKW